ncbi:MAG: putative metal-binding motif-containing protein [Deltaproteobacteria bacterium]|nr:putative metal-binding motif-containing protein [Deltaproteobacteria bacterium]
MLNVAGIENKTGTIGLRYTGLETVNSSGLSVLYYLGEPSTEPDPDPVDPTPDPEPEVSPDNDQDGYTVAESDCNDNNPAVYPGAEEICGDKIDNDCDGSVDEDCEDLVRTSPLYFDYLGNGQYDAYLGLINASSEAELIGQFDAYSQDGKLLAQRTGVALQPMARREYRVADIFADVVADLAYVTFGSEAGAVGQGYCRVLDDEGARSTVFEAQRAKAGVREIYVPKILQESGWKTEVELISASTLAMRVAVAFNNGATALFLLPGRGKARMVLGTDLPVVYTGKSVTLGETPLPSAASISYSHAFAGSEDVIMGTVVYSNANELAAANLVLSSEASILAPYLLMDDSWWSSLVFYNPGSSNLRTAGECPLAFEFYSDSFARADAQAESFLSDNQTAVYIASEFPEGTLALRAENSCGMVGLAFVGEEDAVDCYSLSDAFARKTGVFARVLASSSGPAWSGIVIFNPGSADANVMLVAYDDEGDYQGEAAYQIKSQQHLVGLPEKLFGKVLPAATSIRYGADQEVAGLLVNYRKNDLNETRINIMPALSIDTTADLY